MDTPERQQALADALESRILVLDGAMGTMLQQQHLTADDFGGPSLEGCNEYLVKTRPDVVLGIHQAYLSAGADIIETDTFGGTALVLAEYNLQHLTHELNFTAAKLARQAADEFSTPGKPRFVAASIGPTTKAITVTGGVTFDELRQYFYDQSKALIEGGADILLIETCQDTRNIKAALLAAQRLMEELGRRIPVMVSGTIEAMGSMLAGQTADALCASVSHVDLLSIGLNCATGPEFMTDHIRTLSEMSSTRISCYPNAGLPNEDGKYLETPQSLAIETAEGCAEWLHRRIREDWGFPDAPSMTMHERFSSRYRGKRYSFGYPACPNLDNQLGIWQLIHPEDIGVALTEGMMMEPEASVSALVFHHPDCAYFTAAEEVEAVV